MTTNQRFLKLKFQSLGWYATSLVTLLLLAALLGVGWVYQKAAFENQLAALNQQIAKLDDNLSKQIAKLDDNMSNKLVKLDDKLSEQIAAVDNKHTQAIAELSKINENLSNQIAGIDENLSEVDNKQTQAATKLSKVDENLSKQIATVNEKHSQAIAQLAASKKVHEPESKSDDSTVFQDQLKDGSLGPKMADLPSGTARMGDNLEHSVSIDGFAMGVYEVTVAQFRQFVNATGYKTDAEKGDGCYVYDGRRWGTRKDANWRNVYFSQNDSHPVVCISWNDANAYTDWLSEQTGHVYRLPTSAEWEYAARAGTKTSRYWGNDPNDACRYANVGDKMAKQAGLHGADHNCTDGYAYTAPVGSFQANPSGLFDTAGNVWEWTCSEWQVRYAGKEQQCADSAGSFVLRGGSWPDNAANTRSANRGSNDPTNRNNNYGFRLTRIK